MCRKKAGSISLAQLGSRSATCHCSPQRSIGVPIRPVLICNSCLTIKVEAYVPPAPLLLNSILNHPVRRVEVRNVDPTDSIYCNGVVPPDIPYRIDKLGLPGARPIGGIL